MSIRMKIFDRRGGDWGLQYNVEQAWRNIKGGYRTPQLNMSEQSRYGSFATELNMSEQSRYGSFATEAPCDPRFDAIVQGIIATLEHLTFELDLDHLPEDLSKLDVEFLERAFMHIGAELERRKA